MANRFNVADAYAYLYKYCTRLDPPNPLHGLEFIRNLCVTSNFHTTTGPSSPISPTTQTSPTSCSAASCPRRPRTVAAIRSARELSADAGASAGASKGSQAGPVGGRRGGGLEYGAIHVNGATLEDRGSG